MIFRLLWTLVTQNFKTQRHIMIPFILVISTLFGIEFILLSLNMNASIHKHSDVIPVFIGIGNFFMCLFGLLFILYANRFIMRRRQKELAMNMILGMEKKHFRLMLFIEGIYQYIIIGCLSMIGGYLFGALTYMSLNRILGYTHVSLKKYPFDISAMRYTLLMLAIMMLFLFIVNNIKITFQSPIKLIQQQHPTEKQWPKPLLYILLIVGIITVGDSYMIALKDTLILVSLRNIFIALILVTIGTYCLFISLSVLVIDWLQKIPSVYYRPKYFFTISGLRSRMNSNSIGLASLTMLCTFLIVTLGMSVATYRSVDQRANHLMPTQYRIELSGDVHHSTTSKHKVRQLENEIKRYVDVDAFREYTSGSVAVTYKKGTFVKRDNENSPLDVNSVYLIVMNQQDYNTINHTNLRLKHNEMGILTNHFMFQKLDHIKLMNQTFKTNQLKGDHFSFPVPGGVTLVTHNVNQQRQLIHYYQTTADINSYIAFNLKTKDTQSIDHIKSKLMKQYDIQIDNKDELNKEMFDIYGGLIFVGTIVSLVLMIGTFTMMYYKNIAEGYEDRKNYRIMRQVGLEEERIRSVINDQVVIIFTLPIIISMIHVLCASKMIYTLLGILDVNDIKLFLTTYIGVLVFVMIIYALMYVMTSRVYYRLIHH